MKVGKKQVDRTWRPDRSSLHHPFGDMVWPTCWRFLHGLLRWCKQNFVLGEKRSLPDSLPANNRGSHGPIRATHSLARALTRYLAGGCIYHDHRKVALKSVQLTRFLIVCLTRSTRFFFNEVSTKFHRWRYSRTRRYHRIIDMNYLCGQMEL